MSRRKQANPKPVKVLEEVDPSNEELSAVVPAHPPLEAATEEEEDRDCQEEEEAAAEKEEDLTNEKGFDDSFENEEFQPLVIDTADSGEEAREPANSPSISGTAIYQAGHLLESRLAPISASSSPSSMLPQEIRSRTNSVSSDSSSLSNGPSMMMSHGDLPIPQIPKIKHQSPSKTRRKSDKIQPVVTEEGVELYICPICAEQFVSMHILTKHIRSHNSPAPAGGSSANSCKICGKLLSSQSSLDRHMLVHSGERPFKCNICKMSFTTNGNMHRHSRIHSKEMTADSLQEPTPRRAKKSVAVEGVASDDYTPSRSSRPSNGSVNGKRKTPDSENSPQAAAVMAAAAKRYIISKEGVNGVHDQVGNRLPLSPYKGILNVGGAVEQSKDADEELHCPVCARAFSCKYGLEAHLDSHPDVTTKCYFCEQCFPNPSRLYVHYILAHTAKRQKQQQAVAQARKAINGSNSRTSKQIPSGFHELSFVDFSSDKFSHVAKAWCEENQRRPSSNLCNFVCVKCHHAFPTSSALKLHLETHAPENKAMCHQCDSNFASCRDYELHSMQHLSDKVISSYVNKDGTDNNDVQDMITKEEFLLTVGLRLAKDNVAAQKPQDKLVARDGLDLSNGTGAVNGKKKDDKVNKAKNNNQSSKKSMPFLHRMPSTMYQNHTELKIPQPCLPPLRQMNAPNKGRSDGEDDDDDVTIVEEASNVVQRKNTSVGGPWKCNFCPEVFSIYKAYQDHLREHLPSSSSTSSSASTTSASFPCQQCNYVAGDRSTLQRHQRTHNGERPYECALCKFAFTTKTNCERHVRKRHEMIGKDDIENYIIQSGTNMAALEEARRGANDTICKFCGENFKQFHMLQHHLRTSAVCRSKVFICQLCRAGYPSKMLCLAHIQKAHPKLDPSRYSSIVIVNDAAQDDSTLAAHPTWTTPAPLSGFPLHLSPVSATTVPPTPLPPVVSSPYKAHGTYITCPPTMSLPNKTDHEDAMDVQPLDFSMKGGPRSPAVPVGAEEQPIDLTITPNIPTATATATLNQSRPALLPPALLRSHLVSPASCSPVPSLKLPIIVPDLYKLSSSSSAAVAEYYQPALGCLQCPHCAMLFKHGQKLLLHIRSHATTTHLLYHCEYCNAAYPSKMALDRHLFVTHPKFISPPQPTLEEHKPSQQKPFDVIVITPEDDNEDQNNNNNNEELCTDPTSQSSDSELASVNKIMDATNPTNFQSFFNNKNKEDASSKEEDCQMDIGKPDETASSPQNVEDLSQRKRNSYSDSPHKLQCPHCPRSFPWVSSLKRHLLTHTGIKPYKCPACPVTFSTKSNRERHMIRKHNLDIHDAATQKLLEKPYICQVCSVASYASACALVSHYREAHMQEEVPETLMTQAKAEANPVSVSLAGIQDDAMSCMSEYSEGKMSSIQDFEEEEEEFEDKARSVQASTPVSVKADVESPRGLSPISDGFSFSPEKPKEQLECWKCNQLYDSCQELFQHIKEHKMDGHYRCNTCDAAFQSRYESLRHVKLQHEADWENLKEKNNIGSIDKFAEVQDRVVEEKIAEILAKYNGSLPDPHDENARAADYVHRKLYCSLCPKRFWSLQDLRRHVRCHTGERPFECHICHQRFTLKHCMVRHLRTHEPSKEHQTLVISPESARHVPSFDSTKDHSPASPDSALGTTDQSSGLLNSLLGVEDSQLNVMLNSVDDATHLLGM